MYGHGCPTCSDLTEPCWVTMSCLVWFGGRQDAHPTCGVHPGLPYFRVVETWPKLAHALKATHHAEAQKHYTRPFLERNSCVYTLYILYMKYKYWSLPPPGCKISSSYSVTEIAWRISLTWKKTKGYAECQIWTSVSQVMYLEGRPAPLPTFVWSTACQISQGS